MFRPPFLLLFWDPCLAFVHENGSAKAPQQALLELPEDAEVQLHWGSAPAAGSEWQAIGATGSPGGGGFGWGEKNGKWWVLWNKHSRTSSYMKMLIYIYIFTHTLYIYIYLYIWTFRGSRKSQSRRGETGSMWSLTKPDRTPVISDWVPAFRHAHSISFRIVGYIPLCPRGLYHCCPCILFSMSLLHPFTTIKSPLLLAQFQCLSVKAR